MRYLNSVYIIWYRDVLRFWRNKARMFSSFGFPLLFLVVFGGGLSRTMGALAPGVDFTKFMFPGVIGMTVVMTSVMSGMSIVWEREFGFLKEVLVAPVSRSSVVLGKMIGAATIATIQGIVILVLSPIIGLKLSPGMALLLPYLFIISCSLSGVGIALASRIKSMEAFQVIMQMLMMPMIFLSGVFFPVNNVPAWMNVLVKINPVTYGVDAVRHVILPQAASAVAALPTATAGSNPLGVTVFGHPMSLADDLLVMVAFGAVMLVVAMWSFSRQN